MSKMSHACPVYSCTGTKIWCYIFRLSDASSWQRKGVAGSRRKHAQMVADRDHTLQRKMLSLQQWQLIVCLSRQQLKNMKGDAWWWWIFLVPFFMPKQMKRSHAFEWTAGRANGQDWSEAISALHHQEWARRVHYVREDAEGDVWNDAHVTALLFEAAWWADCRWVWT